jgi:hypothetical protein
LKELEKQIALACTGKQKQVAALQSSTGVKDFLTQHWIEDLLSRFKSLRKEGKTTKQAESILSKWVSENNEKIYSPFLTCKGTPSFCSMSATENVLST